MDIKLKNSELSYKIIIAITLVLIGVISRIVLQNISAGPITIGGFTFPLDVFFVVAAVSIFSGILLGKYYTFIVPVCVIAITDIYLMAINPDTAKYWTTFLFLFTWSGYAVIALLGFFTKRKSEFNRMFIPKILGAGILGILFYDIWTNFGFWLAYSKLGFYPQNLNGLATVYIGGIPAMVWHLLSTALTITLVAIPLVYLKEHKILKKNLVLKPVEKYVIASATVILMTASILTALF